MNLNWMLIRIWLSRCSLFNIFFGWKSPLLNSPSQMARSQVICTVNCPKGVFTLTETETDKLQQYPTVLNTSTQFYTTHFYRSLYRSPSAWTLPKGQSGDVSAGFKPRQNLPKASFKHKLLVFVDGGSEVELANRINLKTFNRCWLVNSSSVSPSTNIIIIWL